MVDTSAASWWTDWCLHCYCLSEGGALAKLLVGELDSDQFTSWCGVAGVMNCCHGNGEKNDN